MDWLDRYLPQIKKFEGYNPRAYWDYKQSSIGYGSRARHPGEVIDKAEAERRLRQELMQSASIVNRFAPNIDPGTRAALTSLTYNAGDKWTRSGLGAAVRAGDKNAIVDRLLQYNKAGGKTLPGLVDRRKAEAEWVAGTSVTPYNRTPVSPEGMEASNVPRAKTVSMGLPMAPPNDGGMSAAQIALARQMAARQMAQASDTSPVGHWTAALARALGGLSGGMREAQAAQAEQGQRAALVQALSGAAGSMGVPPQMAPVLAQNPETAPALIAQMYNQNQSRNMQERQFAETKRMHDAQLRRMDPTYAVEQREQFARNRNIDPNSPFGQQFVYGVKPTKFGMDVTPGQKKMDEAFGKEYAEFAAGGGYADAVKGIEQLRGVARQLRGQDPKTGKPLPASETGYMTGVWEGLATMTDATGAVLAPKALQARQLVEEVVQRNLRIILGAQFTQKEGDRLIARAYNPYLDEKQNAERVERLLGAMQEALDAKKAASDYFEKHGSLVGFKGTERITIDDIAKRAGLGAAAPATGNGKSSSSVLDEARAAIAKGAPREAVMDRLRQMGVDPGGL